MTAPAPEPPEVPADELAAAGPRFPTLDEAAEFMRRTGGRWVPQGISALVMAEYDRRGEQNRWMNAELTAECDSWDALQKVRSVLAETRADFARARADLSRALPVVEAAGALVDGYSWTAQEGSMAAADNEALFESLERQVRAGKGRG